MQEELKDVIVKLKKEPREMKIVYRKNRIKI